jgi:hypothetical protein
MAFDWRESFELAKKLAGQTGRRRWREGFLERLPLHRSDLSGEVQSDFHLRGEAEGTTDEGSAVRVDSDEGTLLPVADAKDRMNHALLSYCISFARWHDATLAPCQYVL